MKLLLVFLIAFVCIGAVFSDGSIDQKWKKFKQIYKRSYPTAEVEEFRFKFFKQNVFDMNTHNKQYENNIEHFALGINEFSDMLNYEFVREMNPPKQNDTFFQLAVMQWEQFLSIHLKKYPTEIQKEFGKEIFLNNAYIIHNHNELYKVHGTTFEMGYNQFSDLLNHEFVQKFTGFGRSKHNGTENFGGVEYYASEGWVEEEIDWRDKGAVTPVKDQGECGASYAFSATGAIEGQHFKATGKLVSLSEQNIVGCSREKGNDGCNGGWMNNVFQYVINNRGIDTNESYPYEGKDNDCHFKPEGVGATIKEFLNVDTGDEHALQSAVAEFGPVSVAIDASNPSFQFYKTGIYTEPLCDSKNLIHAVLVVGYGSEAHGDYWWVKNSWGTTWGEEGYIRMARNHRNKCGIATKASFPLV